MPFRAAAIVVSEEEREELQQMAQSRSLPAGDVMRARMMLLLSEGVPYRKIQEVLDTTAPTISRWKERFRAHGIAGLIEERHPGQQPSVRTPRLQARILAAIKNGPNDGSTHWSCRKLASRFGVSKDTVQRILTQADVRPHRLERYMASDDPDFENKAADVIGLYMAPPQHAAVFCVDEKTAIQALDRLDPVLPLSPGRLERHGFEYRRNGTLSLYAALDVKTGKVQGKTAERHTGLAKRRRNLDLGWWSCIRSARPAFLCNWQWIRINSQWRLQVIRHAIEDRRICGPTCNPGGWLSQIRQFLFSLRRSCPGWLGC